MAHNIADVGDAGEKRGRGRPKGSKSKSKAGTPGEAAAAAKRAEEMLAPGGIKGPIPKSPKHDDGDFDGKDQRRAPAFGANEPDVGIFLKHVQILRAHEADLESAKLTVKNLNKQKKDLREAAKGEGIVLGELDRALKDSDTEKVDLVAREQRYLLYMDWLGRRLDFQFAADVDAPQTPEQIAKSWSDRGSHDGRLGRVRKQPDGCPPEHIQDYLRGFDQGQELLMRGSKLTMSAFDTKGDVKDERRTPEPVPLQLMLHEGHFAAGTALEDANLLTLLEEHRATFDAAPEVIAVFQGKKRILKEEGYVDTGEPNCEVTDPEPLEPRELDERTAAIMAEELS